MKKLTCLSTISTILILLSFHAGAQEAEEPAIITGHGGTAWGQSVEEVKAIKPDIELVKKHNDAPDSTSPLLEIYQVSGKAPIAASQYWFVSDRLYCVHTLFTEDVYEKLGLEYVEDKIQEKYFKDRKLATALGNAGISIGVFNDGKGIVVRYENPKIRDEEEQKAADLRRKDSEEAAETLKIDDLL
jgi:hypothetical protein